MTAPAAWPMGATPRTASPHSIIQRDDAEYSVSGTLGELVAQEDERTLVFRDETGGYTRVVAGPSGRIESWPKQ
jgi:hypothetical protein